MLFPGLKVDAVTGVALLPPKLDVVGKLARWHVLHDVVAIHDLLVGFRAPIVVHAEWLGVAQRYRLLSKAEIWEVVFQLVSSEVFLGNLSAELAIVLALPLSLPSLW